MNNNTSRSNDQNNLINTFRGLWKQNILLTGTYITNSSCNLGNLAFITQSIIQNSRDFSNELMKVYGEQKAKIFELLLDNQFFIATKLVSDMIAGDTESVKIDRMVWYRNADYIAEFLSQINPYWNMTEWQNYIYNYLYMLEKKQLTCTYSTQEDIDLNNQLEELSIIMADYMADGIIKQFVI